MMINVGDKGWLKRRKIRHGWRSARSFYVPTEIVRVTKTQAIDSDGERYRRDTGVVVGDGYERLSRDQPDETADMLEFIVKITAIDAVNRLFDRNVISHDTTADVSKLHELATEFFRLADEGQSIRR